MMTRHKLKYVCVGICSLLLFAAAVFEPTGILWGIARRETFFRNRPSSYWREALRADIQDGKLSDETVDQLTANHLSAPVLMDCLLDADSSVHRSALLLLERCTWGNELELALRRALNDADPEVRFVAIRGLGGMGNDAFGPAVEELIELRQSDDPAMATAADTSLWQIAPDVAGKKEPWQTFRSDKWQFSAAMPAHPEEKVTTMESPFGKITSHLFMVPLGFRNFSVAVIEFPGQTGKALTLQERYDSMAAAAAQYFTDKLAQDVVADQKQIEYNGHSAVEQEFRVADGTVSRIRSLIVGSRSYVIQCVSPGGDIVHPAELEFFFESFRVDYAPELEKELETDRGLE